MKSLFKNQIKQLFILFVFLSSSFAAVSKTQDSVKVVSHFSGKIIATNNGISLIPSFSLGKPALVFELSFGGERLSFDPQFRFALEGKPWSMIFWWRYKLANSDKFHLRLGAHPALMFSTSYYTDEGSPVEVIKVNRFVAAEIVPSFVFTKNITLMPNYLIGHGFDPGSRNTHYLAMIFNFSIPGIDDHIKAGVTPQFFFLKIDENTGTYFSSSFSLSHDKIPVSLGAMFNKKIQSEISGKDFLWSLSLIYSFGNKYIKQLVRIYKSNIWAMVKNNDKIESLEEFYRRKFQWIPENLRNEIGHFNLFKIEHHSGEKPKPVPYKKRDYYKIMLTEGESKVFYADQVVDVKGYSLTFSNPQIPYKWECVENIKHGVYCIFNAEFFSQFGNINQYSVFQPGSSHIFELSTEQAKTVMGVYERMFEEIVSDYVHKYDVLRNLVFELIHFAMKTEPSSQYKKGLVDANKRISMLFMELLERQFPVDESHQKVQLRTASDFAGQLAVHVNHLNRAVKTTTGKTTSQLIAERILQESKILLSQSDWNVSEIAYALGFSEVTHFNNFFKKYTHLNPTKFKTKQLT